MRLEEIIDNYQKEKNVIDSLSTLYLSEEDIDVCNYVTSQLHDIDIGNINYGQEISFFDLIWYGSDQMVIFNDDLINERILNLLRTTEFKMGVNNEQQFGTGIYYDIDKLGKVDRNSGRISRFSLPHTLNELSVYCFGHEQVHALKETNYMEYIYAKSLGEVIPILFEFMIYNPEEVLKKELIKFRMDNLMNNKLEYECMNKLYKQSWRVAVGSGEAEIYKRACLYEYVRSKIGCYLNSFYYALILYHMYRENPDKILGLTASVLNHKMTTMEMLVELGIYGDIRGELFEKELGNIRKLVR